MSVYQCDPKLEINGQVVYSLLETLDVDQIESLLAAHDLDALDPERWYYLQDVLDIFNAIAQEDGYSSSFVAIGVRAVEYTPLPPEVAELTFPQFAEIYPEIYYSQHRNGDAGDIWIEWISSRHVAFHMQLPHPDDAMYGLIYGYARRLFLPHVMYTVYYDSDILPCDQGGAETVIHVSWES